MEKYTLLPQQLLHEGLVTEQNFFHPTLLPESAILSVHTAAYWRKLQDLSLSKKEVRDIGFPVREELIIRGRHIAQGTIDCIQYALKYGVALNTAGGTHHAFADHDEGFCIFNDFAIAARHALNKKWVNRILIIDLDVHQGNGTAEIFKNESRVYTLSVHGERNYPLRKIKSDLDIGLPDGCGNHEYLKTLKKYIPDTISSFKPELILYLSGVDVLETDKLGRLSLSLAGCKARDEYVFSLAYGQNIPVAVSMGGGYNKQLATLISAHAQTFRTAFDIFG